MQLWFVLYIKEIKRYIFLIKKILKAISSIILIMLSFLYYGIRIWSIKLKEYNEQRFLIFQK